MTRSKITIKRAEERRAALQELIGVIDRRLPDLTSRKELMPRHVAALGLARCNRLIKSMKVLDDQEYQDVSGILLRTLVETVFVSLYSLYGGQQARERLECAYYTQLSRMPPEHLGEDTVQMLKEKWDGTKVEVKAYALFRDVERLMTEAGYGGHEPMLAYDLLYRGESLLSTHAGLGSLLGYLAVVDDRLEVKQKRYQPDDGTGNFLTAGVFLGTLASHVLPRFGVSAIDVDRLLGIFSQSLNVEALLEAEQEQT